MSLLFLDNRFENDPLKVVKNEANAVIVAFTSSETAKFSKDATSASAFFCCSSTAFLNSAIPALSECVKFYCFKMQVHYESLTYLLLQW